MRCTKTRELVSSYIDGEIPKRELEQLEFHIRSCQECSKKAEEVLNVHDRFAAVERFNAPYGFAARVIADIERGEVGIGYWTPSIARLAGAAAIIMLIGIGIMSGGFLGGSFSPQKTANLASLFSLDVFSAAPPDSLGGAYLVVAEGGYEER